MEATGKPEGLLEKIRPPRLEDAGLENCALPSESIKEAFLMAATSVRSRAASSSEELDGDCASDPWPNLEDSSDALVRTTLEAEPQEACPIVKGGSLLGAAVDDVTSGVTCKESGDKVVRTDLPEGGEGCVDGLKGLKIGEKGERLNNKVEDDEGDERPILAEAYV